MTRRVVVTGVGLASPVGNTRENAMRALFSGESGIVAQPSWDAWADLRTKVGGPVQGVEFANFPRRRVRTMGRVALLGAYASQVAVDDAGLDASILSNGRTGLTYGSTHGSSSMLEEYCRALLTKAGYGAVMGSYFLKFMSHTCAANLGEFFAIRGRVQPTCSACTSGSQAIGLAFDYIRHGLQDAMIAGGAEELHHTHAGVFDVMFAASTRFNDRPQATPRPFDAQRDGVVTGEGAGTLVLEDLEHALARGAKIYAEVLGYGTNCDGIHLTSPGHETMARCMTLALEQAELSPDQIDYVNAHGTGTEQGDIAESHATAEVFGHGVPVSTQKGHIGHTLGASGAIEAIFSLWMMAESKVPATLNLDKIDPRCGNVDYVCGEPRSLEVSTIMNNNFAFGGINTSLIFRRYHGPNARELVDWK